MTRTGSIATPSDRKAAINALAENYARRRMVDEMWQRGEHPEQHRAEQERQDDNRAIPSRIQIRDIHQFDAWDDRPQGDSYIIPDIDGHAMMCSNVQEARRTDSAVRIQVLAGTDRRDVMAILRKVISWIERDWDCLTASVPDEDSIPY